MVAKGEGNGRGMQWEVGVSIRKLLYIEWINNKVLLYSTENYIQYPMINHNGKEYLKKKPDRQNARTNGKSKAIQTKSPKEAYTYTLTKREKGKKYIYLYIKKKREESN